MTVWTDCLTPVSLNLLLLVIIGHGCVTDDVAYAEDPVRGATRQVRLDSGVSLEVVFIPPGEFMMGSTAAEKEWAVGQDGGAEFSSGGGVRESYEGEPRRMRIKDEFWIGGGRCDEVRKLPGTR